MFRRIGRNVAWLASGRGFAAVVSIAYLAIVARALGPTSFGVFSLILAYGSSIAALAEFQSGQAVIRFGAIHLSKEQRGPLRQLLGFLVSLDAASAVLGALVAFVGVRLATPWLGWTPDQQRDAAMFGTLLLLSTGSTATGILRLFDRFDLITYAETIGPLVRLLGAVAVWALHGEMRAFLGIWALAALSEEMAGWVAVFVAKRTGLSFGYAAARQVVRDNPRILSFLVHNSLASSLALVWQYSGTFAVGATSGAAAAGAFRISGKLATAIAKPADLLTRTLFPELARLAASEDRRALLSLARIVTAIAIGVDIMLLAIVAFAGKPLLAALYGHRFLFAYPFLVLLTIAAAVGLCGIVLEPVLNAHGRSGAIMRSRIAGAAIHVGGLFVLVPIYGAVGAGWSAIASSLVMQLVMAASALRIFWEPPARHASTNA